jgi:hypothetical protein
MRHIYGEVTAKNTDSSYSHQFGSTFSPSKGKEDKGKFIKNVFIILTYQAKQKHHSDRQNHAPYYLIKCISGHKTEPDYLTVDVFDNILV